MPAWLISLIGGPVIGAVVDAYKAKLAAGNTTDQLAADLAGRELAVQQAELQTEAQLRVAQIGKWYEPEHIMGYAIAIYIAKCAVWDAALGLGTTDPLHGFVATTANLIVGFYFGKRAVENVARIVTATFNRR